MKKDRIANRTTNITKTKFLTPEKINENPHNLQQTLQNSVLLYSHEMIGPVNTKNENSVLKILPANPLH